MNTPTNQQLIGYLLGALDEQERAEVEERLARDECLRLDLDALRSGLAPLAADAAADAPPQTLARRTCDLVLVESGAEDYAPPSAGRWSVSDAAVAAAVVLAATLLLFPAVNVSRANALRAGCQNNLRELGCGIARYSQQHSGLLPQMESLKDVSFCGIIDPDLLHGGYVEDARAFVCPGAGRAEDVSLEMPPRAELLAQGARHGSGIRRFGNLGSYAITLGHLEEGQLVPTRHQARATFAVLADMPSLQLPEHRSTNHGGTGQNVLYEDGHVRFQSSCLSAEVGDDIFRNDEGFIAPGMHADDAVIAPAMLFNTAESR